MRTKLEKGDRVSILILGKYERHGMVVDTDYHPLGIDDAIQIKFEDEPGDKPAGWWDARYVIVRSDKK